ncbi:hypothetical protein RAD15_37415 [Bradyrhizobium sp. 14AA]
MNRHRAFRLLHDLSGKQLRTFPDHALARTSWPLEFCDLKPVAGGQAAAEPVGSVSILAQEHLRLDAILIGCMGDGVSARWRERSIVYIAARLAASNPGLIAVPEA